MNKRQVIRLAEMKGYDVVECLNVLGTISDVNSLRRDLKCDSFKEDTSPPELYRLSELMLNLDNHVNQEVEKMRVFLRSHGFKNI